MPAQIHCPQCKTAFAYSPAILGRLARCKQCQHTFRVTAPPAEGPSAAAPAPPPLPAKAIGKSSERSTPRRPSESDRPRRRDDDDRPTSPAPPMSSDRVELDCSSSSSRRLAWAFSSLPSASDTFCGPRVHPRTSRLTRHHFGMQMRLNRTGPVLWRLRLHPTGVDRRLRSECRRRANPSALEQPPDLAGSQTTHRPAVLPQQPARHAPPPRSLSHHRRRRRSRAKSSHRRFRRPLPKWHPVTAFEIKPAPIKADREERPLPSPIEDVCVAGGGRFLILSLPRDRQIAVFDANEARVVKYWPMTGSSVRIAAGMDKVFVADPGTGAVQRWDLRSMQKEVTVPLPTGPMGTTLDAMVTGSAAYGPILVGYTEKERSGGTGKFVDPVTFKEVVPEFERGMQLPVMTPYLARASADGRTFAYHAGHGGEPHAMKVISLEGTTAKLVGDVWPAPTSLGVPSADGLLIYTSAGVFTSRMIPSDGGKQGSSLPARHGPLSLRLQPAGDPHAMKRRPGSKTASSGSTVTFHFPKDERPIGKLEDVDGIHHEGIGYGGSQDKINHDKRVHWIPNAKILVTIPASNDKLLLYRFDPDEVLAKSDIDYLYVTSSAPTLAVKGSEYAYYVQVKSKRGGVKYKLESGPAGMKVGSDGRVTWAVPKDFDQAEADVLLTVSDATGQEVFHSFRMTVKSQ